MASVAERRLLRYVLFICAGGILFGITGGGFSYGSDDVYTIADNVDLVLLDVSVKDRHGQYVEDLRVENFQAYEDGRRRAITHFENVDAPVTVGLIVDTSGSMRFKRPDVIAAGLAFAQVSNPKDEFFVVNFNNRVQSAMPPGTDFTDQLPILKSALYYGQPVGQTALYDAVAYALRHLERSHRDLRTLIVVSDGGDNVSRTPLPELMTMIERSRATIYSVGLLDPEDRDLNPRVLRKFASVSGGEFFQPKRLEEVMPVFKSISKDIRRRYTIGFAPDEVNDKRTVRTVKVSAETVSGQKLKVKSRTTFVTTQVKQLVAQQGSEKRESK